MSQTRSKEAEIFHELVSRYVGNGGLKDDFEEINLFLSSKDVNKVPEHSEAVWLADRSAHRFSHLQDIIHLPFATARGNGDSAEGGIHRSSFDIYVKEASKRKITVEKLAEDIAFKLLRRLVGFARGSNGNSPAKPNLNEHRYKEILKNRDDEGYSLLLDAAGSSEKILDYVIEELKRYPHIFEDQLGYEAKSGFGFLNRTLGVGKPGMVKRAVAELKPYPEKLQANLGCVTRADWTCVQIAIDKNDVELVKLILEEIEPYKEIKRKNFKVLARGNFSSLQTALMKKNPEIIFLVLDALASEPEAMKVNLEAVTTENGYCALSTAILTDNPAVVSRVIQELEKDPQSLEINLCNVAKKTGYTALAVSLRAKNPEIFRMVFDLYAKDPEAMKIAMENTTDAGTTILHHAFFNQNQEMVDKICAAFEKLDLPQPTKIRILKNYTNSGFSVLHDAAKHPYYLNRIVDTFDRVYSDKDAMKADLQKLWNERGRLFTSPAGTFNQQPSVNTRQASSLAQELLGLKITR